jgi:TonB-linked SusC/RagA family outer membrane protein
MRIDNMTVDRMRGWLVPLVAACLVGVTAQKATGQTVVTGKVTNQYGAAVPGATVLITSLKLGGTTNDSGVYAITVGSENVRGQTVTATARFIGYAPLSQSLTLSNGSHTLDFALKADPFQLNAVITTGVADSTSARNLTFSAAKVTAAQVEAVPASDALSALTGKVAGLMVSPGTGSPGDEPAIRLRGSTCLQAGQGCNAPLVIVDGVITTESISDLDVNNIQSMEILKGAAGASFYGSNAANGVISITTKSGRDLAENHVSITAHGEYGQNSIAHYPSFNHGTLNTFDATTGAINLDAGGNPVTSGTGFDDTAFPTFGPNAYRDQMKLWTNNNDYYNSNVSLGLRRGNTNFTTAFSSDHNGGIVPFRSGQFRQNVRLNIDQGIGDQFDLSSSVTYGVQNLSNGGNWFALYQAPPDIDLRHPPNSANDTTTFYPILPAWADPSQRGNPLYSLSTSSNNENRQHFLGSVSGRYRPTSWLRLEANYGTDRLNRKSDSYTPRGTINSAGQHAGLGSYHTTTNDDVSWNSMLRATATKLYRSVLSTTSVAYQLENSDHNQIVANADQLNVNNVPTLSAGDVSNIGVSSFDNIERTIDYMVSQSFDIKDRYIIDGLYRRDGSSLFGSNDRWSDFYRVAGAYRLSQDFHIPGFQELKLHVAQGTAGLRPNYSDQYETYSIGGGQFSKQTVGNKNLTPAVLTETEYGINADFLDRFTGEITYANDRTKGAFLQVPLSSAATGGFTSQWQNAADLSSHTIEGALQTRMIDRRSVTWDLSLTADHTTQKITSMSVAPFPVSAGGQGQGVFWYQSGQNLGVIYGTQFVRTIDQAVANHSPTFPSTNPADYVVNPLGYVVLAANRGTAAERPIPLVDAAGTDKFVIGDVNPKLNYGVNNDVRWNRFSFHSLFSGQVGGSVYNFSKQWRFQDLRAGEMDMTNVPQDQKIAEAFFTQGLYNGLDPANYFVESGAYLKLQELSVGYDVNPRWLPKVGLGGVSGLKLSVLGRNLYTWTNYSGFDPDVTSGSDFNFRIDGFRYPPFRSITGQVEIRF